MKVYFFILFASALKMSVRKMDLVVAGRIATSKFFNSLLSPLPIINWLDDLSEPWLSAAGSWSITQLIDMIKLASRLPSDEANLLAGPDIISMAFHSLHHRYGRILDYRPLPLEYLRMIKGPGLVLMLPNFLRDRLITEATRDPDLTWTRGLCEHGPHARSSTFRAALSLGFCHHRLGLNGSVRVAALAFPINQHLTPVQLKLLLLQSWYYFAAPFFPVATHPLRTAGIFWIRRWLPKWLRGRPGFESIAWLVDLFHARIELRRPRVRDELNHIGNLSSFEGMSATERARYSLILFSIEMTFGIESSQRLSNVLESMQSDLAPINLYHFLHYFQYQRKPPSVILIRDHARTLPRFHRILQTAGHSVNAGWTFASRPQLQRAANRFRGTGTWHQAALAFLNQLKTCISSKQQWLTMFQMRTLKMAIPVRPCKYESQILREAVKEYYGVEEFEEADLFDYLFRAGN